MLYLLRHSEGEYDSVYDVIDAILSGPAGASEDALSMAYGEYVKALRDEQLAAWKALPRPKAPMRYKNIMSFMDWLIETRGFEKVEFQDWNR